MKVLVFTLPYFIEREAMLIQRALDKGVTYVHVRKPECLEAELEQLISAIPSEYRGRLVLHEHFELAVRYGIGGVHLNRRWGIAPTDWRGRVSRSCHEVAELKRYADLDYCTLSPVFDSVSKQGYMANFTHQELLEASTAGLLNERTIALGGIAADNVTSLKVYGFGGVAVLGKAWGDDNELDDILNHIK